MTEIPDELVSMFSAELEQVGDRFVLEVPHREVELGALAPGATYRVSIISTTQRQNRPESASGPGDQSGSTSSPERSEPPVEEGEVRSVTIESVGDQGDGIAKVDRGYVVIVPGAEPGDNPTVEIEEVRQNVSFARVLD